MAELKAAGADDGDIIDKLISEKPKAQPPLPPRKVTPGPGVDLGPLMPR